MKKKIDLNKDNSLPLYLFHQGTNFNAYDLMGAHVCVCFGKKGVMFRTWAPKASSVSVVGDFNCWNKNSNVMNKVTDQGVYELFVEGLEQYDTYKFAVTRRNKTIFKADPYAFHAETPSATASKVYELEGYNWNDADYQNNLCPSYNKPINIYEVNLASWKKHDDGKYYSYLECAKELVDYVYNAGYTHVEFMPLSEYPFDGSWGYQVTGYFSITSRFGTPKDFMALVDAFHQKGIGVIMDWVPAHFATDEHGLFEFDGTPTYEYSHWSKKEHKGWGTRVFDWGKTEVQSFLISSAIFLFEKYHIDGIRVDAVASMLYLDYGREEGEWEPNKFGGNYNLEAVAFLKKLNKAVFERFPNALMIAEESTSYPMITKPVHDGGLGFNYKWNMGWMNDVLTYMQCDPYFRSGCHDKLTFSLCYAFSENYILPISHDEVVHGKKSLLDKMPGDIDVKFANLRVFNAYMYSHPGKKLTFMGNEYGQFKEWADREGLEFFMTKFLRHKQLQNYNFELNFVYKNHPALFENDCSWEGFNWISVDERDNNVIAYERLSNNGQKIIILLNFSGNDYINYRLGVEKGKYKLILNTDRKSYGGKGLVKKHVYKTEKISAHNKDCSINLILPAFTGLYLLKTDKT